jgi:FkbM family methyltransferase
MTRNLHLDGWLERWLNRRKLRKTLANIQKNGFAISTVYDIGANKGRWSRDMRRSLPRSDFFLFEANEKHREKLASRGFPFFICVLGSKEESRRFYSIGGTGDSLYLEKSEHYEEGDHRTVTTQTLQKIAQENKLPPPNFIKLDVQGAELDILAGSEGLLDHCHVIYMECPVLEYNAGAPTFDAYVQFMSAKGYVPLQILEQHVLQGALIQVDILFVSKSYANTCRIP